MEDTFTYSIRFSIFWFYNQANHRTALRAPPADDEEEEDESGVEDAQLVASITRHREYQ